MPLLPSKFTRQVATATALVLGVVLVPPILVAADSSDVAGSPSAMSVLIKRLAARGVLSKGETEELRLLAEADAADARAQVAAAQAAEARALAAEARARALAALLARQADAVAGGGPAPDDLERTAESARETDRAVAEAKARLRQKSAELAEASADAREEMSAPVVHRASRPSPVAAAEEAAQSSARAPAAGSNDAEETADAAPVAVRHRRVARTDPVASEPGDAASDTDKTADDTVRVTYVPEVVQQRLREEVKQDVLDDARKEGWATPRAVPDWVSRFRLFGDFRLRGEGQRYPTGNDVGGIVNYNTINTGAPFDLAGTLSLPTYNEDQERNRLRLRARLGTAVDLGENFSGGLRLATGENNSPVTQNQSLGAAGSGQGGNFSKYALWLDRAFLKYEIGGLPDEDLACNFGRFDNPFVSTGMLWADDIGFDGVNAQGRLGLGDDITPFFTVGAFPVFNTDLNFATNQAAKFKSNDKWLYAAQLGTNLDLGKDFSVKLGVAYYLYRNIEGRLSSPFTPTSTADVGDTDATRPAFAQKGNTYMPLRDIVPGPNNGNGTTNQFQYFGLASKFRPLALDARIEFNHFEPFQVVLTAEYVKNLAFDPVAISPLAVNNLGPKPTTGGTEPFLGTNTAWLVSLTLGDAALQKRWDWNVNLGYRKVGTDALVDGFTDSDFGGGGTNVKGFTFGGNLALSSRVWLGLRWMSANEVVGPIFKSDVIQFDLNGKF